MKIHKVIFVIPTGPPVRKEASSVETVFFLPPKIPPAAPADRSDDKSGLSK